MRRSWDMIENGERIPHPAVVIVDEIEWSWDAVERAAEAGRTDFADFEVAPALPQIDLFQALMRLDGVNPNAPPVVALEDPPIPFGSIKIGTRLAPGSRVDVQGTVYEVDSRGIPAFGGWPAQRLIQLGHLRLPLPDDPTETVEWEAWNGANHYGAEYVGRIFTDPNAPGRFFRLDTPDGQRAHAPSFQVTQHWSNYTETDESGEPL
jgi:hypothetical protein